VEPRLATAARLKVTPDAAALLPAGSAARQRGWLRAEMAAAVPALAGTLRWELGALLGGDAPLATLLERWVAAPRWRARARAWLKLALHPLPAPRPLSARRALALARRSTPRALAYAAGVTAYLALGQPTATGAGAGRLPLAGPAPVGAAAERAAITAFWRWCIRND
jgi:hypothetical protein